MLRLSELNIEVFTVSQRRGQNAEKVMHIKVRLLDQAMILYNCVPFQMGTSLKGKICSQRKRILTPLKKLSRSTHITLKVLLFQDMLVLI